MARDDKVPKRNSRDNHIAKLQGLRSYFVKEQRRHQHHRRAEILAMIICILLTSSKIKCLKSSYGSLNLTTLHDRSQGAILSQKTRQNLRAGLGFNEFRAAALAKKDFCQIAAMNPFPISWAQYHSDISSGFGAQTTSGPAPN